jgi:hypothetical protein
MGERDELGDDTPFEYATSAKPGSFYGWLGYYLGAHEDPRQKGKRPDLKDKVTVPDVLMQAHTSPLQIAFENGSNFARLQEPGEPRWLQRRAADLRQLRQTDRRSRGLHDRLCRLGQGGVGPPGSRRGDQGWLVVRERGRGSIASDVLWHKRPVRTAPRVGETIPGALVVQGHPKRAKSIFVRRKKVNHARQ